MPTVHVDEELDYDEEVADTPEEEQIDDDAQQQEEAEEEQPEEEVVAVTLEGEDEEPEEEVETKAPPQLVHAVKATRTRLKEINRENRELRRQVEDLRKVQTAQVAELGPKPTLESSNWDGEKFEADLDAWKERKRKLDQEQEERNRRVEDEAKAWKATVSEYESEKVQLTAKARLKDFEEAEEDWKEIFTPEQQGILLHASKKKAPMVYYLGKHPDRAHALAAIKDPVKLVYAIAELEGKLKVQASTSRPSPDTPLRGGGASGGVSLKRQLEKAEAEADRTGNRTEVLRIKRMIREREQSRK